MAKVLITDAYMSAIGSAIRTKNGQSTPYKPSEMASAILSISGSTSAVVGSLSASSNGIYHPSDHSFDYFSDVTVAVPMPSGSVAISSNGTVNVSAFAEAVVDVPNNYSAADEGKVVVSGALSAQTSSTITENGTYDTTLKNEIEVAVSGGSAVLSDISISQNGSYAASDYNFDGFANVVVNVSGGGGGSNDNFLIVVGASTGSIYDSTASFVGDYAFASNKAIIGVEMTGVTSISSSAFYGCTNLVTASFPECSYICPSAFYSCTKLESIAISKCEIIGEWAFTSCKKLKCVDLPSCSIVTSFVFFGCISLSTVSLPICEMVYNGAFSGCASLAYIELPSCSSVSANAFAGCTSLSYADLPSCIILSSSAFNNCYNLQSISLPVCEAIGSYAFFTNYASKVKIENITLPACKSIYGSAFKGCISLKTAFLPVCSSIWANAFADCSVLESVYLLSTAVCTMNNSNIFSSTPMLHESYLGHYGSIFVPASLVDSYKAATNWSYYADRITAYVE